MQPSEVAFGLRDLRNDLPVPRGLLLMLQPEDLVTLHRFLESHDDITMPNNRPSEYAEVQNELKAAVTRRMVDPP